MGDSVSKYFLDREEYTTNTTARRDPLKTDPIVEEVKEIMDKRSQRGIKEYGMTLQDNPDGFYVWLKELQEELLDAALYIQKLRKQK
tara:strand:- start:3623 stop:3883 length:261 start_codon:yes stop_codon:yes gene_type:complete